MEEQELFEKLKKFRWSRETFEVSFRGRFRCEYCDKDLLASVENYDSWQTDQDRLAVNGLPGGRRETGRSPGALGGDEPPAARGPEGRRASKCDNPASFRGRGCCVYIVKQLGRGTWRRRG